MIELLRLGIEADRYRHAPATFEIGAGEVEALLHNGIAFDGERVFPN